MLCGGVLLFLTGLNFFAHKRKDGSNSGHYDLLLNLVEVMHSEAF